MKDARYSFFDRVNSRLLINLITVIVDQNFDIILFFWNAIFERINWFISFWLKISDRKSNESEFSNRIWTYFRLLVSIESINKRWLKILLERIFIRSFSIIFFHLRFHSVENILNQLFCFFMFILDSMW